VLARHTRFLEISVAMRRLRTGFAAGNQVFVTEDNGEVLALLASRHINAVVAHTCATVIT